MGTDIASFAKQLKEEGIEAAKAEAAKIIEEAQKKAEKIISTAKSDSEKLEKDTQTRIQQNRVRSEDEMRLVARDLIINFKKKVEDVGVDLLKGKVAETLKDDAIVKSAVKDFLKDKKGDLDWEVSFGKDYSEKLAKEIVAMFKGNSAKLGEAINKAGFEIKQGNEVFEVTEDSVTEAFKQLLSPALKKLLEA
jgi:V/A-type H+-transporting ATPase subunit E